MPPHTRAQQARTHQVQGVATADGRARRHFCGPYAHPRLWRQVSRAVAHDLRHAGVARVSPSLRQQVSREVAHDLRHAGAARVSSSLRMQASRAVAHNLRHTGALNHQCLPQRSPLTCSARVCRAAQEAVPTPRGMQPALWHPAPPHPLQRMQPVIAGGLAACSPRCGTQHHLALSSGCSR